MLKPAERELADEIVKGVSVVATRLCRCPGPSRTFDRAYPALLHPSNDTCTSYSAQQYQGAGAPERALWHRLSARLVLRRHLHPALCRLRNCGPRVTLWRGRSPKRERS